MDEDDDLDRLAELELSLEDAMVHCSAIWDKLAAACAAANKIEVQIFKLEDAP
jgi:hypothetical protein